MKGAVQALPAAAGIGMANRNWKVEHWFVSERFGIRLSRSSYLNYLHRLRFVLKRHKKRLLKADEAKREAFVAEYVFLSNEARQSGARIFFADETRAIAFKLRRIRRIIGIGGIDITLNLPAFSGTICLSKTPFVYQT